MTDMAVNKTAKRDYEILETFEAGLKLRGHEVKSVRAGHIKLQGAFVAVRGGEVWLIGAHIPAWKKAGQLPEYDSYRVRKLLLHKREISRLIGASKEKGLTLVPIRVYNRHGKLKLEFGIGRGRKQYEKREIIRRRELDRKIQERLKKQN